MDTPRVVRTTKYGRVDCLDKTNSCHQYEITDGWRGIPTINRWAIINFQNGPIGVCGPNGCQNEDLIAIVIDHLKFFQQGGFSCRENANALIKLEEALMWLEKRTADRIDRGVEEKNEV